MRNLKRCITLFLSLAIMLSFAAGAVTFPDVPARSPTGEALQLLTALDVIGGYPDGSFGQDKTISRAEYLKILFVLINGDRSSAIFEGGTKFPDVTDGQWFSSYVNWASESGIVGGYPDGSFGPDRPVSVAEAAKMFLTGLGFSAGDFAFPYGFIDKAVSLRMFTNISGLGANAPAPRGAIAIMAYNSLFVETAPRFSTTIGGVSSFKTPLEAVHRAQSVITTLKATSTANPGAGGISKAGQIALAEKAKPDTNTKTTVTGGVYNYATDVDALLGHNVKIWFRKDESVKDSKLGSSKKDFILVITDAAYRAYGISTKNFSIAGENLSDTVKYLDLYSIQNGEKVNLFPCVRTSTDGSTGFYVPNTTGKTSSSLKSLEKYMLDNKQDASALTTAISEGAAQAWARDKYYKYWNSDVPADLWVVNYGAADPAFGFQNMRPYNSETSPFTHHTDAKLFFIDNDDELANGWSRINVTYSRTSRVKAVTSASVVIEGINGGAAINAAQLSGSTADLQKDMFVSVTVKPGLVEGEVKDIYTVKPTTVLTNRKLTSKTSYSYIFDAKTYYYTAEWFAANPYIDKAWSKDRVPNFTFFKDALKFTDLVVGKNYDVVLTQDGYIFGCFPVDEASLKYMLVSDVDVTGGGFRGDGKATVTGVIADGTNKTFSIDTTDKGLKTPFEIDGKKMFDPKKVAEKKCWIQSDGQTPAVGASDSVGIIGELIGYTLNSAGEIKTISAIKAPNMAEFMSEPSTGSLYGRAKAGTGIYGISYAYNDSSVFFVYDDAGTPGVYKDDKFSAIPGSSLPEFRDTVIRRVSTQTANKKMVETALVRGPMTSDYSDSTKLAYITKNFRVEHSKENEIQMAVQLLTDGKSRWYTSKPVDISSAAGDGAEISKLLLKSVLDEGEKGSVHALIDSGELQTLPLNRTAYISIDKETGELNKIFCNNYSKTDLGTGTGYAPGAESMVDPELGQAANSVHHGQTNKFYRASLAGLDGRFVTLNPVNRYMGRAYKMGDPVTEKQPDGSYKSFRYYTNDGAPQAMYSIADDCIITLVNQELQFESSSATRASVGELKPNNAGTYENYVVEYTLGRRGSGSDALEIKQMIAYEKPTKNRTESTNAQAPLTSAAGVKLVTSGTGSGASAADAYTYKAITAASDKNSISPSDFVPFNAGATVEVYANGDYASGGLAGAVSLSANLRYKNGEVDTVGYSTFYIKVTEKAGQKAYHKVMISKELDNPLENATLNKVVSATYSTTNDAGTITAPRVITKSLASYAQRVLATDITAVAGAKAEYFSDSDYTNKKTTSSLPNADMQDEIYVRVTAEDGVTVAHYKIIFKTTAQGTAELGRVWGAVFDKGAGAGTKADPQSISSESVAKASLGNTKRPINKTATGGGVCIEPSFGATLTAYSDAGFANELTDYSFTLTPENRAYTVYIKVTAQDGKTEKYFKVLCAAKTALYSVFGEPIVLTPGTASGDSEQTAVQGVVALAGRSLAQLTAKDIKAPVGAAVELVKANTSGATIKLTNAGETTFYKLTNSREAGLAKVWDESEGVISAGDGSYEAPFVFKKDIKITAADAATSHNVADTITAAGGAFISVFDAPDYTDRKENYKLSADTIVDGVRTLYAKVTSSDRTVVSHYIIKLAVTVEGPSTKAELSALFGGELVPSGASGDGASAATPVVFVTVTAPDEKTTIAAADFAVSASATVGIYSDSAFQNALSSAKIYAGGTASTPKYNYFYIKVTAEDGVTEKFHKVIIKKNFALNDEKIINKIGVAIPGGSAWANIILGLETGAKDDPKTIVRAGFASRAATALTTEFTCAAGGTLTFYTDGTFTTEIITPSAVKTPALSATGTRVASAFVKFEGGGNTVYYHLMTSSYSMNEFPVVLP